MSKDHTKKNSFFKLDLLILSALRRQDCYGYEISSIIKEHTDGIFVIKEGVLYPILYRMVEEGYITSYEKIVHGWIRVYYHLEEKGLIYLDRLISEFQSEIRLVDQFIQWSKENPETKVPDCS